MKGQWVGRYTGDGEGTVVVNVDERAANFYVEVYVRPDENNVPFTRAEFSTPDKSLTATVNALTFPVDPFSHQLLSDGEIARRYGQEYSHSRRAVVDLRLSKQFLHLDARTDNELQFSAKIRAPKTTEDSEVAGQEMSWSDFKVEMSRRAKRNLLYRGQKKPWRLSTSFHRRGRYCATRFITDDVKQLHRRLSAITNHYFDLNVGEQNGAFLNLIQHHGYPTPLLDWSRSPYVAAFFAYRDWPIQYDGNDKCRIYCFDEVSWRARFNQISYLDPSTLHLSVMEFVAIDNPRVIPQQSVTTVTNIDRIEEYIQSVQTDDWPPYLEAIDLPANERDLAIQELKHMGIAPGAMFPGIEGVCEEYREQNFDE